MLFGAAPARDEQVPASAYGSAPTNGEADEVIAEGHTYTFPDGLAPVEIDHERDRGSYREPNVWIVHVL